MLAATTAAFFAGELAPLEGSAQTTSPNGKIAFVRLGDIWVMDADGTNEVNLTNTAEIEEGQPDWSPDGAEIAFTWRADPGAGGFGEVYVMDADPATDDARNLTNTPGFNEYQPSWAPSGARLAFVREVAGEVISEQPDIFVMGADGGNSTNLTETDESEHYPAWSPDGTKIAFAGVREGGWEILTMDPNGQNENIRTGDGLDGFDEAPEWSPNSTKIVFMKQSQAQGCCEPWEVWAVNRDGSDDTNLTNHPSDDMGPSWSPDGSEITFSSTRDAATPGEADVYAMAAPTTLPPPGTTGAGLARAALPFAAGEMTAATTVVRRLTTDKGSSEPDWGRDAAAVNTAPTITNLLPPGIRRPPTGRPSSGPRSRTRRRTSGRPTSCSSSMGRGSRERSSPTTETRTASGTRRRVLSPWLGTRAGSLRGTHRDWWRARPGRSG